MRAIEKAATLSCWSGPVEPVRIEGGISNDNFVIEDGGRKYVARVNGDVPVHGVLRINDYNCNTAAAAVGVAPAVFHYEPGVIVADFIDGRTYGEADVRRQVNLDRIIPLIKTTHRDAFMNVRGPVCAFWPFRVCRDYAFYLEEHSSRMTPDLPRLRHINEELEKAIGPIDLVLGHSDLLAANFIDDGSRIWLIDWEHAGFSSPLFDLANLASNNGLSPDQEAWMLESYYERQPDAHLRHRYQAMKCASLLREAMWSMVSEINSTLDFDYVAYSDGYMNRFLQTYAWFQKEEYFEWLK